MKKTHTRIAALLGILALAVIGGGILTGCFTSVSGDGESSGVLTHGPLSTERVARIALSTHSPGNAKLGANPAIAVPAVANIGIATYATASGSYSGNDLAAAFAEIPDTGSYEITLSPGTYKVEGLSYKGSATVKIKGTGTAKYGMDVLIYGQGSNVEQESTRSTLSFQGACNIILENVAIQNPRGETTGTAQAETLGVGGTPFSGTLAAYNCAFLSGQDTICTEGKAWFYDCYIEGDVDFLWMESYSSKVALYENCRIRAIDTRTTKAYFTAPRLATDSTVGKGLVIYNSTLEAENGLSEVYLGRNPWDAESDAKKGTSYFNNYYENVAIVGTKYYGRALNPAIWSGSGAHGTPNQQFVGFKTDTQFKASASGIGARLTAAQVSAEYAGRNNILNRVYNVAEQYFQEDNAVWDTASLVAANGWNVTSDTSSSKLASDSTKTNITYVFSDTGLLTGTDATLTNSGFQQNKDYALGNAGATLTFWVVGDCKVTVNGYYSGGATVSHGSSSASYTIATQGASDSATLSLTGISSAGEKVTVKATAANTYITSINVQYTTNVDAAWVALKAKLANATTMYDFTDAFNTWLTSNYSGQMTQSAGSATYSGATLSVTTSNGNFKYDSGNGCMTTAGGQIVIPVTGACKVTVTCHSYNSTYISINGQSGTSGTSLTYDYTGGAGNITINSSDTSQVIYIYSVKVELSL